MTPRQRQQIEERLAKITPGRWCRDGAVVFADDSYERPIATVHGPIELGELDDAAFIAAAPHQPEK